MIDDQILVFVGDAHGKTERLASLVRSCKNGEKIFQLGDMGLGFRGVLLPDLGENFKWIRGNHDDPKKCRAHANYLGDFGFLPEFKLFYLAGAFSIDRAWRVENVSWWADEELSLEKLRQAYDLYVESKPAIVISHEAPSEIVRELLRPLLLDSYHGAKAECGGSRTSVALQQMWDAHKPNYWFFGHHHIDKEINARGTRFRCCNELSTSSLVFPKRGFAKDLAKDLANNPAKDNGIRESDPNHGGSLIPQSYSND